jgi:mRNA-decapping enzyme subunit 2
MIAADAPEVAERSQADTNHLQFLLSRLNMSKSEQNQDAPTINQSHANQLALELKKMLSIGQTSTAAATAPPAGVAQLQVSPPPPVVGGSLMSLLRPNSTALLHTPADQLDVSPPQAQTQHHHNRKAPQNMPPPHFLHPAHNGYPQHRFSFANTSTVYPQPPQFQQPPMVHQLLPPRQMQVGQIQHVPQQMRAPSIPFPGQHHVPGPIGPHPTPFPPSFGATAHQNAPAANMPPSKLNQHSLTLLNTFKTPAMSTEPVPVSPETKSLELPHDNLKRLDRKASSASQIIAARFMPNAEPGNSNAPRNTHQSALLGLFRNGPPMAAALPAGEVPVAELSAGTPKTLGKTVSQSMDEQHPLAIGAKTGQSNLTSATVSGPLNAPDFGAVQRARAPVELGDGQENSHTPVPVHAIASGMVLEAPRPFHPLMILQRQQQYTPTDSTATGQVQSQNHPHLPGARSDDRGMHATEQKSALLSLFNAKAPAVAAGKHVVKGPRRRASGNGSPVSPLPDGRVPVKQAELPLEAARSRVGSLADEARGGETPITPVDRKFLFKYLEDMVNGK